MAFDYAFEKLLRIFGTESHDEIAKTIRDTCLQLSHTTPYSYYDLAAECVVLAQEGMTMAEIVATMELRYNCAVASND